ncbi:MAG: AgmX/PglI C-terminal domain-containing protein [Deltaproteobacteria bacterium]|nr:AgmX/PglI C-terminal domain-containing protein [Deltaproteobacteria bacterium]
MTSRSCIPALLVAALVASIGCARVTPSRRNLRSAVEAKRGELTRCWDETIARNARARGNVVVWMNVDDESGRVTTVEVEANGTRDDTLGTCVSGTLQAIQLSEPPPLALRVQYTLLFEPTRAAPPPPAVRVGPAEPPPPPAVRVEPSAPPPPAVRVQPPPPPAVRVGH